MGTKKPKISRVKELIDAMYKQRREWIEYNTPSVSEVIEVYPSLQHGKLVSIVLFNFVGCLCACGVYTCMCVHVLLSLCVYFLITEVPPSLISIIIS